LKQEARLGFATFTLRFGEVGTHEHPINPAPGLLDNLNYALIDIHRDLERKKAPAHRRLVGDNDNLERAGADLGQSANGLRKDLDIVPGTNVA